MALRLVDSAEYYSAADIPYTWDYYTGVNVTTDNPRPGHTKSLQIAFNERLIKYFDAQATWIVGAAIYFEDMPQAGETENIIIRLQDSGSHADNTNNFQVGVCVDSMRRLKVRVGSVTGTILETSSDDVIKFLTHHYIEFKCTINNTTGSYEVKLDGTTVLSGTNVDTQDSGNAYADRVSFGRINDSSMYLSDIYIFDGSGGSEDDFWGMIKSETLYADGAGIQTDWTPSTGSNYQNVDETSPDEDSTYNSTSVANNIDSFSFDDVSLSGTIKAVIGILCHRYDDGGPHTSRLKTYVNSTFYNGGSISQGASYTFDRYAWLLNPDDAAAWENADVNGAEFGYELLT